MKNQNSIPMDSKQANEKVESYSQWPAALLILVGAASFIVAGYFGLLVKYVVPKSIEATNSHGMSWVDLGTWSFIGALSVVVWVFGCIAARCHSVLYERWFK